MAEVGQCFDYGARDACDVCNERPARNMKRLSCSSVVCGSCLQNWLAATVADIEVVQEQGRISSQNIDKGFDELERLLLEERDRALSDVDQLVWTQLDYFEEKKRTLETALQRHATALDIAEKILSPKCSDAQVLLASSLARDGLTSARDILDDFSSSDVPPHIYANVPTMDKVKESLARAFAIGETHVQPDGANTIFEVPPCIDIGKEAVLTAKLFDSMKCPLTTKTSVRFECYIVPPSGGRINFVARSCQSRTGHLVYRIPVTLTMPGEHTLRATVGTISSSAQFTVGKKFRFDQEHCHPSIKLMLDDCVAERLKSTGRGEKVAKVLGAFSFSEGSHIWSLRLNPKTTGGKGMYIGITSESSDTSVTTPTGVLSRPRKGSTSSFGGPDGGTYLEDSATHILWRMDGKAYDSVGKVPESKMQKWKKGDVLTLQLYFEGRRSAFDLPPKFCWLTCANLRLNEEKRLQVPLEFSTSWCPVVLMTEPGSSAELLSYSGQTAPSTAASLVT